MITRGVVPPRPEAPSARPEADRSKKRGKKPVEVLVEEPAPAKKKAFVKKSFVDRKARQIEIDTEERTPRWREERRPAVVRMKKTEITVPKASKRRVKVGDAISVGDLAKKMGVKASEVINKLMGLGMMATINQAIDFEAASLIAAEFGYQAEPAGMDLDETLQKPETPPENLKPRAPVVTIMGHVDHGKTSLLDAIRETNVIDGEAGGITQAIGAYHVHIKNRDIVFLDTPGHEAFTAMRARGAQVTDIVVLVVAADDGVMDQTVEAINHSRDAGVPIVVAINKIDKAGADPGRIKQALTEYNLVPEEWGGDTIFCEVSAKQKTGIEELLELLLLQADILELKADPDRPARGVIIEAKLDRGRGPVATVLIQEGTLKEGDAFVSRTEYGRVRAMIDDKGRRIQKAGPSTPVEVIGFSRVPQASSEFIGVEDERKARSIGEYWIRKEREKELSATAKITLEQLYERMKEGVKELNVILKADVQGSIEALTDALRKLGTADIKIKIIHSSTGAITETDIMLASASNAVVIGFNVRPDARVIEVAEAEGVEIKLYDIIYNVIADMKAAMEGLLEPEYREVSQGRAEVRNIFKVPRIGTVAGCYVTDGKMARSSGVKLVREGVVVYNGRIASLRRFKDDVKEVATGFECGIGIENYNDIHVGDVIEAYTQEAIERKL
jgi:translation initiation factor IF-2